MRPAGTSVAGSSTEILCSLRSARSASSSRARASSTRPECISFALPAATCASRFMPPATILGSPAFLRLRAALPARRAARSRASCNSRFSRLRSCSALRMFFSATSRAARAASSYAVKFPPWNRTSPRSSSAMRSIRSSSARS